jgi:hypothetical protein
MARPQHISEDDLNRLRFLAERVFKKLSQDNNTRENLEQIKLDTEEIESITSKLLLRINSK